VIPLNLQEHLQTELHKSAQTMRPITNRLQGEDWRSNAVLWAEVPTAA
jgi:hypothetical protein